MIVLNVFVKRFLPSKIHNDSGTHNKETKMRTDLHLNCYTFDYKHNWKG